MFRITIKKGFQISFPNGWTVSVQFGAGNYCDNRDNDSVFEIMFRGARGDVSCSNAEVAVFKTDTEESIPEPKGWMSPVEVAAIIAEVANRPAVAKSPAPNGAQ